MGGRIGTLTLAVLLLVTGGALLAHNLELLDIAPLLRWWPLILVLLGAEMVLKGRGGDQTGPRFHGAGLFLLILLTGALALASWVIPLVPGGWTATTALLLEQGVPVLAFDPRTPVTRQAGFTGEGFAEASVLRLVGGHGVVTVRPGAAGQNEIRWEATATGHGRTSDEARQAAAAVAIETLPQGETVEFRIKGTGFPGGSARATGASLDLRITIPPTLAGVTVQGGSGAVEIDGITADVAVFNSLGSTRIIGVDGDVQVHSEGGEVIIAGAGTVEVTSRFGPVEIAGATGPVMANVAYGPLDVRVEGPLAHPYDLAAEFGAINLRLPESADAHVTAGTRLGSITIEGLPVEEEPQSSEGKRAFRLGQGGIPVSLQIGHGTIHIVIDG